MEVSVSNIKILIVDDELIMRESLAGWLERDGHTVQTAASGITRASPPSSGIVRRLVARITSPTHIKSRALTMA